VVAEAIWDGQKMSYPPATMVLGLTALLLFSGARAAERQYQLHFLSRLLKNPQTGADPLLSDWDFQSSRR
jgi:hypothetical protein